MREADITPPNLSRKSAKIIPKIDEPWVLQLPLKIQGELYLFLDIFPIKKSPLIGGDSI